MTSKAERKRQSHEAILREGARLFRENGISGAGVEPVMAAAGLTHGGFYAHFKSKTDLVAVCLASAMAEVRNRWLSGLENLQHRARLSSLVSRYLNDAHVADAGDGCPVAAAGQEIGREEEKYRAPLEAEINETIRVLESFMSEDSPAHRREEAIGTFATCIGGLVLARTVVDPALSHEILHASRCFILRADLHGGGHGK